MSYFRDNRIFKEVTVGENNFKKKVERMKKKQFHLELIESK